MFKQRSHKTFQYKNRFLKEDVSKPNLDSETDGSTFVSKWKKGNRPKVKSAMSLPVLIFVLVLLLVSMYFLEKRYM